MEFNGYRLIESADMVITVRRAKVRTVRERLLSWPWRPFTVIKFYAKEIPRQDILLNEETRTVIMHPEIAQKVRKLIEVQNLVEKA